jgi:hypothetical protein
MIDMRMREENALDLHLSGRLQNAVFGSFNIRVNQRIPVVLTNQIAVDRSESREFLAVLAYRTCPHDPLPSNETPCFIVMMQPRQRKVGI